MRARSAGAPSAEPRSRVSGPNSARNPSRALSSSRLAIAEPGGAHGDPLLLAAQPGQQPPRLGALAIAIGKALLGRAAALAHLGQALLDLGPLGSRLLGGTLCRFGSILAEAQLLGDQATAQLELLALDPGAELGRLRLALQRPQPRPRLALQVECAVEVVARSAQLQLGAAATLAVLAQARGLLDQQPPLARFGVDDRLDPTLADHRVHLTAEVGVGEDLDNVDKAAAGAV